MGHNIETRLDEWEKNQVKSLFKEFDKNKSQSLEIDELKALMKRLTNDEAIIGKVPAISED